MNKPLLIGIGNRNRGDDAIGLELASKLANSLGNTADIVYCHGNVMDLIEVWRGRGQVFLIDAISSSESDIGKVQRFFPLKEDISLWQVRSSTHAIGIGQVIELAKAIDSLPDQLVLYGVHGYHFAIEQDISQPLQDLLPNIVQFIEQDIREQLCMK